MSVFRYNNVKRNAGEMNHVVAENSAVRQGSLTVEAAFVCSFLCLVVVLMVSLTLHLYEKTKIFGTECVREIEEIPSAAEMLRIEHAVGSIWDMISDRRGE